MERPFTGGKLITALENALKTSIADIYFLSIRESSLEKNATHVMNVGNLLAKATASMTIGEFTQEKSLMSVGNVGNPLDRALASFSIGEFTLEQDLMSVMNVENYLATNPTLLNIGVTRKEQLAIFLIISPPDPKAGNILFALPDLFFSFSILVCDLLIRLVLWLLVRF